MSHARHAHDGRHHRHGAGTEADFAGRPVSEFPAGSEMALAGHDLDNNVVCKACG
ncbi:hypothetical protein [Pseudoxanthomonas dokdonensis]|uniref:hypothetical protein n=1 Tax=Pseudoxanthomonas dokdonensis TaxID=344882 RepID=UPI0012ED9D77|nr:hypothetical protein [Pseudoxanthomonas dokdonensis]